MMQALGGVFKQQHPSQTKAIEEVMALIATKFRSRKAEIVDMVAPLYAAEFTVEELNAVAGFYATPIGKKLVEKQPGIVQKSVMMGMRWGQKIGKEVETEFRTQLRQRGVPL
jgi:hypothetical protein